MKVFFFQCGLCGDISQALEEKVNGCPHCKEGNPFMKNLGFVELTPVS